MLRVGLTGGLGSGKSTIAALLREEGMHVLEADAIARAMMEPGQPVYRAIVEHFGSSVVRPDGTLDRGRLAALSFGEGRLDELTRIVHPPVIAEQEQRMEEIFSSGAGAIAVIESALIFEADASGTAPGWRKRFDRIVLVTAPDEVKMERYLIRMMLTGAGPELRAAAEQDARGRMAAQLPDSAKIPYCDFVIDNSGTLEETRRQVDRLVAELRAEAGAAARPGEANRV